MSTRKITLYNTRGSALQHIDTDVQTWGELKPLVSNLGFDVNRLNATENITKNDLVLDKAILPDKDFTIFFRQKDTKAGTDYSAMSYKEARKTIQEILASTPEASAHFNEGKNYTTKGTEELRSLLASYAPATPAPVEAVSNVADVVASVAQAKPSNISYVAASINMLDNVDVSTDEELEGRLEFAKEELQGVANYLAEKGEEISTIPAGYTEVSSGITAEMEETFRKREAELEAREKAVSQSEQKQEEQKKSAEQLAKEAKELGIS